MLAGEETAASTLDGIPILGSLGAARRAEVARLCRWRRYHPQEQIIDRQSETREVLFIVQGAVRIVIYSVSGRELTLDDLPAGNFFGEMAAIDGYPRSASVMAVSETVVAGLTGEQFCRLLAEEPDFNATVMRRLVQIVRSATERIIDLSTLGANNRVHAELLRQALQAGVGADGTAELRPIPVHGEMASRVSTTRETVARVMNDLARKNVVKRGRDSLIILDVQHLRDMVEGVRGE